MVCEKQSACTWVSLACRPYASSWLNCWITRLMKPVLAGPIAFCWPWIHQASSPSVTMVVESQWSIPAAKSSWRICSSHCTPVASSLIRKPTLGWRRAALTAWGPRLLPLPANCWWLPPSLLMAMRGTRCAYRPAIWTALCIRPRPVLLRGISIRTGSALACRWCCACQTLI